MAEWKDGELVTVRGRVATVIWQHVIGPPASKTFAYFDLEGEDHQTVVYWTKAPGCAEAVEVTGRVLVVTGPPKRPGRRETKVDASYSEVHLDVDEARCVE